MTSAEKLKRVARAIHDRMPDLTDKQCLAAALFALAEVKTIEKENSNA